MYHKRRKNDYKQPCLLVFYLLMMSVDLSQLQISISFLLIQLIYGIFRETEYKINLFYTKLLALAKWGSLFYSLVWAVLNQFSQAQPRNLHVLDSFLFEVSPSSD